MEPVPSSGMLHQAKRLLNRLEEYANPEFPREARLTAELLAAFAQYIRSQLSMLSPGHPADEERISALLRIVQELHSYVRYIKASASELAPPSVHDSLVSTAEKFFQSTEGEPLLVVRPQWKYNLKYVPLTRYLENQVQWWVLDPNDDLGILRRTEEGKLAKHQTASAFLDHVWAERASSSSGLDELPSQRPRRIAVLSFAGLDREDILQTPILAHELGHYFDFSHEPPLHEAEVIASEQVVSRKLVEEALEGIGVAQSKIDDYYAEVVQRLAVCAREILADLLAVRLMGFSFFCAQANFLPRVTSWPGQTIGQSGYPGIGLRISLILEHLEELGTETLRGRLAEWSGSDDPVVSELSSWTQEYLEQWNQEVEGAPWEGNFVPASSGEDADAREAVERLAARIISSAIPHIKSVAEEIVPQSDAAQLDRGVFSRVGALENDLPPWTYGDDFSSLAEIFSAAWIHHLRSDQLATEEISLAQRHENYARSCRLILKAVELANLGGASKPDEPSRAAKKNNPSKGNNRSGVLSKPDLEDRLARDVDDDGWIGIQPLEWSRIQQSSYDVRLGHRFKLARRSQLATIDLESTVGRRLAAEVAHERVFVRDGQTFTLHPGDFVLAATLEFVALPGNVMAYLEGRSSLGRAGLTVATATSVAPGFHGCVVLELANTGSVPLKLSPGADIAQLVFVTTTSPTDPYRGTSHCQIGP